MSKFRVFCYGIALFLMSCRTPFIQPNIAAPSSYLVVEGVINCGGDSTTIKLSKTVGISSKTTVNPVVGATVMVENNQNSTTWPLVGDGRGNYVTAGLNLSSAAEYRLSIITPDGRYVSDYVPVTSTPPVDSVGYLLQNGSVELYVNAHDPTNKAVYYRWDYRETWIFHAEYFSKYIADTVTQTIVPRPADKDIYYCFGTDSSSAVLIASTHHLAKSVVYQNPIAHIALSSEKLEQKYSVLVNQYAITADAYTYYENLKNNTEQVGTIFSAMPSQIVGNIHNLTNPSVPAIGYVTATNVQSKRIFISSDALPYVPSIYPYACEPQGVNFDEISVIFFVKPGLETPINIGPKGYIYSSPICADCTVRGTTKTPSFWK